MTKPVKAFNWLPLHTDTIYFITVCVEKRARVLNNSKTWNEIRRQLEKFDRWKIVIALAMPDHLHLLVAPTDREESPGYFIRWFKRNFKASFKPDWNWQEGCFDRLLRTEESAQEKWDYIRQNPVRAGLAISSEEWPYQMSSQK